MRSFSPTVFTTPHQAAFTPSFCTRFTRYSPKSVGVSAAVVTALAVQCKKGGYEEVSEKSIRNEHPKKWKIQLVIRERQIHKNMSKGETSLFFAHIQVLKNIPPLTIAEIIKSNASQKTLLLLILSLATEMVLKVSSDYKAWLPVVQVRTARM